MKLNLSLNSDKSVDDFFEYLVRTVVIQEKFKYLTWIESSSGRYVGKLFYGLVNKDSFKIVPLIYGKNFFTPVILGVIKRSPKQKSLEITFVDSPHMKVVKIILFTLLLGTIFAFSGSKDIICVFPFSLSLVILIFFLLFNHHAKNDAALTISKSISLMM